MKNDPTDDAIWHSEIRTPMPEAPGVLHVDVDALALLNHFDDDEAKTFEFLGKLKDLFV